MKNRTKFLRKLSCLTIEALFLLGLLSHGYAAESSGSGTAAVEPFCGYLGTEGGTGKEGQGLTLCDVLRRAMSEGVTIKGQEQLLAASEGRVQQGGLIPNPILLGDLDKKNEEMTVQLSQTIELGGKRGDRMELARLEQMNSKVSFEARRVEILEDVKKRFIGVLLVQDKLAFAQKRQDLAKAIQATAQRRVDAGRGMPVEAIKASLAVTASELEVSRLNAQLSNAKRHLSAIIGAPNSAPVSAIGNLANMPVNPSRLRNFPVEKSPAVQRAMLDLELRKAELNLAQSTAVPDVTLSAGARRFKEEGTTGMVVGLAIPIPILNRNQGAIREARGSVSASEFNRDAERLKVDAELLGTIDEIKTAYAESMTFKNQILPAAEKAFASANEVFQRGKLDYLNVLDAQRDLFNSREQYLQSLAAYHEALADLERLTGKGVSELLDNNGSGEK